MRKITTVEYIALLRQWPYWLSHQYVSNLCLCKGVPGSNPGSSLFGYNDFMIEVWLETHFYNGDPDVML